jgi:hypothetical protein
MLEAADSPMPGIDVESSVNPEGQHVKQLEKLAEEAGVPKSTEQVPLNQTTTFGAEWEKDLK